MAQYRIISQPHPQPQQPAKHRSPRGSDLRGAEARLVTVIEADDLHDAVRISGFLKPRHDILEHRVVSVEEIHPGFSFTDDEITMAFAGTNPLYPATERPLLNPDDFEDETAALSDSDIFRETVREVANALRESGLVPGIDMSIIDNEADEPYAMLEVYDDARGVYLSRGTELRRVTDNRSASGWQGVLAIARELITLTNDLH